MEKRNKNKGYSDDAPMTVYKSLSFGEFLNIDNPYPIFIQYN